MHMRSLLWPSAFRVPSKRALGRVTGGPVAGARSQRLALAPACRRMASMSHGTVPHTSIQIFRVLMAACIVCLLALS